MTTMLRADCFTKSWCCSSGRLLRLVRSEVGDCSTRFVTVRLDRRRGTTRSKLDSGYLQPGKLDTEL